jgi:hypothetical protein
LQNVNVLHPRSSIQQTLQQLEAVFWKKYNINLLKPSKEQLQLLTDKLNQAKVKKEMELLSRYYFNILRTMIAYIIIIIFVRYPDYTIQVIIPSCVKLLSYVGYPISDKTDSQRSLVSYFACLLTKISVSDDVRFALFYEKDSQEIQNSIKEAIDGILSYNLELKIQLELIKPKLSAYKVSTHHELDTTITEMQGFKPNFKFGNVDRTNQKNKRVLSYMKSIQETVASSKMSKQSVLNIPNLFNACCAEVLRKDIDFFDYFETSSDYKTAKNKVSDLPMQTFKDINLHPNTKKKESVDLFAKYKIEQSTDVVAPIHSQGKDDYIMATVKQQIDNFLASLPSGEGPFNNVASVLSQCNQQFDKTSWWDDNFYPMMHVLWDEFVSTLKTSVSDKFNIDTIEYIKSVVVDVGSVVEDIKTTRNVLFNFLHGKLNSVLGSIRNVKKLNKEINDEMALRTDVLYSIIVSVSNNKNYENTLQHLDHTIALGKKVEHLYFQLDDDEVIVKNVSLLAYILISSLHSFLKDSQSSHATLLAIDQNIVNQDNLKISSMIVMYILEKLSLSFSNTLVDPTKLKKVVEELRERRKQELIASYKVDDEERQLQITLKNMGLENWADILAGEDTEQNEPVSQTTLYKKDEYDMAKEEIYDTFKGEHNDTYGDDDDDDEDVMVSYEAYDY